MIRNLFLILLVGLTLQFDFSQVENAINENIDNRVFPGCVIGIYGKGIEQPILMSFGHYEYPGDQIQTAMTDQTIFDLASVSKVVGATTAAMVLWERGLLNIDAQVSQYIPEFSSHGKDKITVRNLLLHNSGLPADPPKQVWTHSTLLQWLFQCELAYPTGQKYVYSDLSMITLQLVIEKVAGASLDVFLYNNVFLPLGVGLQYNPPASLKLKIAPTQIDDTRGVLEGSVHDPTCYYWGGVCGNAGLFGNIHDLMTFSKAMLSQGPFTIAKPETIDYWTKKEPQAAYENSRALGWDTLAIQTHVPCGSKFSQNTFSHTGYTGTSICVDKDKEVAVVVLTNRVYPDDKSSVVVFRSVIHDLIMSALGY